MTTLEALEKTSGKVHTVADWRAAGEKAYRAPASLSDLDLAIIEHFDGEPQAMKAREARAKALNPPVEPPPVAQRPVAQPLDPPTEDEDVDGWWTRHARKASPMWLVHEVWKFVKEINEKNIGRNARLDAHDAELAAVKQELATLKGTTLKMGDVWTAGKAYQPGDTCIYDGSIWQCHTAHVSGARPGIDHQSWKLAVKHGRDGKDAR